MQEQTDELSTLIAQTQSEIEMLPTEKVQLETELMQLNTILAEYRSDYRVVQQEYEQLVAAADGVVIIEPAQVPVKMVSSRMQMYITLATVVGVMLGIGVAFLVEYLDDTIKTPVDVTQSLGLLTLGVIGQLKKWEHEIVMTDQPHSPAAEAFRLLRANIRSLSKEKPLHTLLVTSPGMNEGKSVTVANLAVAMAQAELNAVAVEADLHRPRLYRLFGIQPHREKWSTVHLSGNPVGQLHLAHLGQLSIHTSPDLLSAAAGVLGTNRMQKLLVELAQGVDVVLLDTPSVLSVADTIELAQIVDGVLLVVRSGNTRRQAAQRALESLRQAGANTLGVVLTAAPETSDSEYYASEANGVQNGRWKLRLPKFEKPKAAFLRLVEKVRQILPN
jgi:capsular exopolysaccharide synthesis family protein